VTGSNRSSGSDPVAEFQRWLMRSSAKNLGREIKGTFRRTFGGGQDSADVWESATSEPPPVPGEAPECAWCPVCRAARRFKDSGPGLASHVAGAGDALLSVAQDTIAAFEATLAARPPGPTRLPNPPHGKSPEGTGWPAVPPAREPAPAGPAPAGPAPAGPVPAGPVPDVTAPAMKTDGQAPVVAPDQPTGEGQKAPDGPDHRS
jgi:hypothetical protein